MSEITETSAVIEKQEQGICSPISKAEFAKLYGAFVTCHEFKFEDGRSVRVEEFENAYILRCFNATHDPPSHYTYTTLSREAMYSLMLLYIWPRTPQQLAVDEAAMRENLTDEYLEQIDAAKAEMMNAELEAGTL